MRFEARRVGNELAIVYGGVQGGAAVDEVVVNGREEGVRESCEGKERK